jgi:hypothetical protein
MTHSQQVAQFLRYCQQNDPEKFKEVCKKYPVLSNHQWQTIGAREINVGLVGLGPTHIPNHIAADNNIESPIRESDS